MKGEVRIDIRVAMVAADMVQLVRDLYGELGTGSDLDWHLRDGGYARRIRDILRRLRGESDAP